MYAEASIGFLGIVIALGFAWVFASGLLLQLVARFFKAVVQRPIFKSLLSFGLACVTYFLGLMVLGIVWAISKSDFFGGLAIAWGVSLPTLALLWNMVLIRDSGNHTDGSRMSWAHTAALVISTQGLLLALIIACIWLLTRA